MDSVLDSEVGQQPETEYPGVGGGGEQAEEAADHAEELQPGGPGRHPAGPPALQLRHHQAHRGQEQGTQDAQLPGGRQNQELPQK